MKAEEPVTGIPEQSGLNFGAEGFHKGSHDGGDNSAGKTDVIKRVSHVSVFSMKGNGNQNIAYHKSYRNSKNKLPMKGQSLRQHDLRDNGREGSAVKSDIEILFNRYSVYLCI